MIESDKQSDAAGLRRIRPGTPFEGKQGGHVYRPGVSAETAGSKAIHMQLLTIPPGGRARAHLHETHETAIYILSGSSGCWYGDNLEHYQIISAGEFCYIAASVPHLPFNRSTVEPCTAVIARTDPNEQESVVLLPELEAALLAREG